MHAAVNFGVGSWIERHARVIPDRLALVGDGRSLTYADLAGRVRRLGSGLQRMGVRRGDLVAWLGSNHPAFLESLFACGLVGAALAPVNHRLPASTIRASADAPPPALPAVAEKPRHKPSAVKELKVARRDPVDVDDDAPPRRSRLSRVAGKIPLLRRLRKH